MISSNEYKILALEARLHKLKTDGKNEDSPGVIRKIERKLRRMRGEIKN